MKTLATILVTFVLVGCTVKSESKTGDSSKSRRPKTAPSNATQDSRFVTRSKAAGIKAKNPIAPDPTRVKAAITAAIKKLTRVRAAIAAIKKLAGKVTFAEKKPGKPVIGVFLSFTKVTDVGLVHLKGMTNLQKLLLSFTKVTDAGLVHLKGMTKLQTLYLSSTNVTDAGLVHLKGMTNLQRLYLSYTKVTDAGLVHLKGMTKLQTLDLKRTKVTDAGVKKLQAALPKCEITR